MMKKYKVGDTIYVKGIVRVIDDDDKKLPYYVDFGNTGWIPSDNIIDELPTAEPVKPVLTEKVVLSKEQAKIVEEARLSDVPATYISERTPSYDEEPLMRAYVNGYTVKKEPVSLVKVPGRLNRTTYYAIKDGGLAFGYLDKDKQQIRDYSAHKFTDEEITKFDLQDCEKELVTDDSED